MPSRAGFPYDRVRAGSFLSLNAGAFGLHVKQSPPVMSTPPTGIPEADLLTTSGSLRTLILVRRQGIQTLSQENDELRPQLTALAIELASLRERIGRSARHSAKPPSSDDPGVKPPVRRMGSGRKRGWQEGHPGSGPALLPIERLDAAVGRPPRCLPVFPCCSTSTCALLPADVEESRYGPRLSALVGLLDSAFPLTLSKTQALLARCPADNLAV